MVLRMADDLKFTVQNVLIEPVFNNIHKFSELFLRINYDGTILDITANSSYELYVPDKHIIGKKIRDILPEKIHDKIDEAVFQSLGKNRVKVFEYSTGINDGIKYYKAKFFPSINKQVIVIINEITKSKRTVKALKQSENKLRIIWENSKEGMRLINSRGAIVAVNNAYCKMFEMEESELIGKPFNIIYRKLKSGSLDESHKLFRQRFTSHSIENFLELKVVLKNEKSLFLEIVNTFIEGNEEGQGEMLLSIFRDITERKKSEEATASLAAIVDSSNDAIIGCTLNGIIDNWNYSAEKLYGFTKEEISGNSFLRINPDMDVREFRQILENIKNHELFEHYETFGLKKNGSKFLTSVTISPIKNIEKVVTGFSAIVRDITERKKAEVILRESEEKYRTLIETSPDAIALFDLQGNLIMGNIQVAKTFGFRSTLEFARLNILGMISEEDRKRLLVHAKQLEIIGTLKNVHYNLLKKNGEAFSAEISASLINDDLGAPKAVICVLRDITERINSELALKRSEEQFRSIWENSGEGMCLSDPDGKIIAVNSAYCTLAGLVEEEIIGRYFYELYNENAAAEKERYRQIFLEPSIRKSHQAQYAFISGKTLDLYITYSVINQEQNPVLLSIFHDLTETKKSEKELRKSEKLAAIGKMAAYLAHEIKTPLASIKINIDMMSKTLSLPKDKQRSFSIIQKEVKRLHNLLKNVLQFSRQVDLVFMDINLYNLVNSIQQLFEQVLLQNQIIFVNRIPEDISIIGDQQKLLTVFSHLIENAVEALPKRGRIELFSNKLEDQKKVEVYVKDTGGGIQNTNLVFEPFYTTKHSGTGLGLSIAQKIIEQHNGTIEIYSSVPGETVFKIELNMSRKKNGYDPNN